MDKKTKETALENELPSDQALAPVLSIFKAVSDPTRLKIILLIAAKPRSVGDIVDQLAISQSAVSHQLQMLRQLHLVAGKRNGKEIHYQLTDEHIMAIYQLTADHVAERRWG